MALIVHKYGGTSMGSTERIRNVAKRVAKWARAGHQMVVVPSAMSGETNRLLGLAKDVSPAKQTPAMLRELDMIACTGEQVSVSLLSHYFGSMEQLIDAVFRSILFDAAPAGGVTMRRCDTGSRAWRLGQGRCSRGTP